MVAAVDQNYWTSGKERRIYEDYKRSLKRLEFEEFLIKSKSDQSI